MHISSQRYFFHCFEKQSLRSVEFKRILHSKCSSLHREISFFDEAVSSKMIAFSMYFGHWNSYLDKQNSNLRMKILFEKRKVGWAPQQSLSDEYP